MPQISIIVPVYNVEKYIRRCIDSILAQTFTNFELILVDDGSPDHCGAICDEYAAKYSHIRVIHKKNGGLSSARNAGLDIAVGNYILFCDSDDYVAEDWCEQFVENAIDSEDNYIFGGIQTVHIRESSLIITPPSSLYKDYFPVSDYLQLQTSGILGFACNVLYYASILKTHHLRFSEDVIVEDLPFNLEYLRHINQLTYTNKASYFYVHDDRETLSSKFYPELFRKWQEKYRATQVFINEVIPQELQETNRQIAANKYIYLFLQTLENTFDRRNSKTLLEKIQYNCSIVSSPEFQHCLRYANTECEDPRIIRLLMKKQYPVVFLLNVASKTKHRLLERIK